MTTPDRNAAIWFAPDGYDPAKVAAVGFSAGGHLGATLATGFAEPVYAPRDATDALDARPAAMALIYPVISVTAPVTHAESAMRLLGNAPSAELIAKRSPAQHVTAQTPPVFLVHALDDKAVPAENSFIMLRALQAAIRPVEVHLFEAGNHGFGVGRPDTPVSHWLLHADHAVAPIRRSVTPAAPSRPSDVGRRPVGTMRSALPGAARLMLRQSRRVVTASTYRGGAASRSRQARSSPW